MSIYRNTAFLIILMIVSLSCRRKENVDPIVSDDKTAVEQTNTNKDEIITHYSVNEDEKIDKTIKEIYMDAHFLPDENGTLIKEIPRNTEMVYKRVFIKDFEIDQYCYPDIRKVYENYNFDSNYVVLPDDTMIKSCSLLLLEENNELKCWLNIEYDANQKGWIFLGKTDPYKDDNWAIIGKLEVDNKTIFLRKYTDGFSVGRNQPAYDRPSLNGTVIWYSERTDDNDQINLSTLCVTNDTFQGKYFNEHWVKVKDSYDRIGWFPGNVLDVERGGPKYLSPENCINSLLYEP